MQEFHQIVEALSSALWGIPTILLLVGVGIFISVATAFIQLRKFGYTLSLISGKYDDPDDPGEISHFQALNASLTATIGVGNIAGVGTAIAMGGPGALVWMWLTAIFGMGIKYGECLLSLKYRVINKNGIISAGPMYYLERGLKRKWLGVLFALFAAIASLGIGNMVQSNSVAEPLATYFAIPKVATGLVLAFLVFLVIVGGIKRIAQVASKMVPIVALYYIVGALIVIITNFDQVGLAFNIIFHDAFTGTAATGGFTGAALASAIRFGIARGVFSNEAGLGSAPIAHGAAKTREPVREGLVAMLGPFIDTIVFCTMTALVIVLTGAHTYTSGTGDAYTGAVLTAKAFEMGLPGPGGYTVAISIIFFALSAIITWSYYGDRCVAYLFGEKLVVPYRYLYCLLLPAGAAMDLNTVWLIGDCMNVLMMWPNLVGILFLTPIIFRETKKYFNDPTRIHPDRFPVEE
ncbi:MAG: sodium:alanine symporter family protein [Desulfobacteraceae bacterium]|nr:sodium:alanine symporter family protein [Desulfobacteraceae bacterium]